MKVQIVNSRWVDLIFLVLGFVLWLSCYFWFLLWNEILNWNITRQFRLRYKRIFSYIFILDISKHWNFKINLQCSSVIFCWNLILVISRIAFFQLVSAYFNNFWSVDYRVCSFRSSTNAFTWPLMYLKRKKIFSFFNFKLL